MDLADQARLEGGGIDTKRRILLHTMGAIAEGMNLGTMRSATGRELERVRKEAQRELARIKRGYFSSRTECSFGEGEQLIMKYQDAVLLRTAHDFADQDHATALDAMMWIWRGNPHLKHYGWIVFNEENSRDGPSGHVYAGEET